MQNYETNVLKQEWMENLDLFTREMDYPREAAVSLSQSLEQVFKSPEALSILTDADRSSSESIREMKMRQTVRLTNFRNWRKLQKRL